jgi:putative ABC transport system ATP-binding protein
MTPDYLIDMHHLTKAYYLDTGEAIPVLKGIDFRVKKNEFVAIMGESGSGKSTLLNIIGFLHSPSSGLYLFDGDNVSVTTDSDILAYIRREKIGFIFQQFCLLSRLNVLENVSLPAIYAGSPKQEREEKAMKLIERVGLSEKIYSRPGELSG